MCSIFGSNLHFAVYARSMQLHALSSSYALGNTYHEESQVLCQGLYNKYIATLPLAAAGAGGRC